MNVASRQTWRCVSKNCGSNASSDGPFRQRVSSSRLPSRQSLYMLYSTGILPRTSHRNLSAMLRSRSYKSLGASNFMNINQSPYAKALQWILHDDDLKLTTSNSTLLQRYFAAYLYYATSVAGHWSSCNPKTDPMTCVDQSNTGFFWLSNTSECRWAGVTCDNQGQIAVLDLGTYHRVSNSQKAKTLILFI